ncbi:uncharacterized protein C1orf21 homolog isoform X2 [Melanotaenia boesemani]|uniref:uncharacterized protein C1orf21 homolog isoform X2 n=1 Tax=Melanotaenia boesemani TaxID=1250792 RepID=UPI001C0532B0|nr:uncharacterized protein C1orf21 homolog isoform X2 [Melanotaenia boesemani]
MGSCSRSRQRADGPTDSAADRAETCRCCLSGSSVWTKSRGRIPENGLTGEVCLSCSGLKGRAAEEKEMGCTSAKQVSAVPNGEEGQNKAYSNGDLLSDEYKMKEVEKVKYICGEDAGVDGHDGTEKSALLGKGQHTNESGPNGKILSIHSSESQQEFFRMLDEKIEKGRDYCSEEEDVT